MKDLNNVQYVSKLLLPLAYNLKIDIEELITAEKKRAVAELFENYPTITYCEISFTTQKASRSEVNEAVEYFKCRDGRYIYDGEFVSREFLEKELSQIDANLFMTAWIKEKENEVQ